MTEVQNTQCLYFLEKKKRFCRFKPKIGQKYCPEHSGLLGAPTDRKRIACPLDSKHTCYEDQLSKHLKKCRKQQRTHPAYYCPGINSGETDDSFDEVGSKITLSDIATDDLKRLIEKINKLYDDYIQISSDILSHPCLKEELSNSVYGIPAIRHRKQQASLIGHLDKMRLIRDDVTYVELGAGKGMLSHWIQKAGENSKNCNYVLVDRGTCRYKADNFHKWDDSGPKFERIRIDIEHLNLGKVKTISDNDNSVVAVGKHLCGSATDLAFRCVIQTLLPVTEDEPAEKKSKLICEHGKFGGLSIALCCHHRCQWKPYVGKTFFTKNGLSSRDFQIICKLSSWTAATWTGWKTVQEMNASLGLLQNMNGQSREDNCLSETKLDKDEIHGSKLQDEGCELETSDSALDNSFEDINDDHVEHNAVKRPDLNMTVREREEIGRKCKRLIDYGRVDYLKTQGLDCDMKVYIEEQLTPENVAIFAKPVC